MPFITKISKDSSWDGPGRGAGMLFPAETLGSGAEAEPAAARHWELSKWLSNFIWKTKRCSSKPISNACKALCKQHSEGVTYITKGSERVRGQAGLVSAAAWGCKAGWLHSLFGTGERPGKPACCSCWGCWKSKETTILGRAGKTWKCAPWGLIPANNPAFKKKPSCRL